MLHQLIHTLSQNEKRYFKIQSSLMFDGNDKRFVKLFDIICNQKDYNEELVKQKCQEKHFPQLKAQLFDKIMESLRAFHSSKNIQSLLANDMANYRLLLDKLMINPAAKSLKRATLLATKYELLAELIQIKQAEIELLVAEGNLEKLENHIRLLREQIPEWNKQIDHQLQVEIVYLTFVKLNRESEFIRSSKEQQILQQYISADIFKNSKYMLTTRAKAYYFYIMGLYHFLSGNFTQSLNAFENQLELLESRPHFADELMNDYAKALANVCLMYNKTGEYHQFQLQYQKLLHLKSANSTILKQIQLRNHLLLLNHYVSTQQIHLAFELIKNDETHISLLLKDSTINSMMVTELNYILFDKVYVYMFLKQFDKANKIIHSYLNSSEYAIKSDHYILARILHLFVQLELGHYDYIQNELRNLIRFLKENKKLYEFEKCCLRYISLLINETREKSIKDIWQNFKSELTTLSAKRFECNAMLNFNFIEWANFKAKHN